MLGISARTHSGPTPQPPQSARMPDAARRGEAAGESAVMGAHCCATVSARSLLHHHLPPHCDGTPNGPLARSAGSCRSAAGTPPPPGRLTLLVGLGDAVAPTTSKFYFDDFSLNAKTAGGKLFLPVSHKGSTLN